MAKESGKSKRKHRRSPPSLPFEAEAERELPSQGEVQVHILETPPSPADNKTIHRRIPLREVPIKRSTDRISK
jgi:hypothetical protein